MKSHMREIVFNTGPVIALVAATGGLSWLSDLYGRVWIPNEVYSEILAGGYEVPELVALKAAANVVQIQSGLENIPPVLVSELDHGEASVIQTALNRKIETVAIDEKTGRRVARLHGLKVTGSLGILVRARNQGIINNLTLCVSKMRAKGIWISDALVNQALSAVGEPTDQPPP
jgi:predicted nucleic acid-binding protein